MAKGYFIVVLFFALPMCQPPSSPFGWMDSATKNYFPFGKVAGTATPPGGRLGRIPVVR
jgi:hypothetical protein